VSATLLRSAKSDDGRAERRKGGTTGTTERRETRLKRETQTAADKSGTAAETTEDQRGEKFILLLKQTTRDAGSWPLERLLFSE